MKSVLLIAVSVAVAVAGHSIPAQAQARPAADALFRRADVNNDGRVSRLEFDAAREALFAQADANHDARLTLSELRAMRPDNAPSPQRRPGRAQLHALRAIDRNNDRAVDLAEFRASSGARFASADANRDGFVTRDELAGLMAAMDPGR